MTDRVTLLTRLSDEAISTLDNATDLKIDYRPELMPAQRYPGDHKGDPGFQLSPALQREWLEMIKDTRIALGVPGDCGAGLAAVVRNAPRLEWLQATAAGAGQQTRAADLDPEHYARIRFTTGASVHTDPLAEFAMFGLLAGARQLPRLEADKAAHRWPLRWEADLLSDGTLLILGYGSLGQAVARRATAFGMNVHAVTFSGPRSDPHAHVHCFDDLDDLLQDAAAVVVALPRSADTVDLLNARRLDLLRPGATVVNIGRGEVLDEAALRERLVAGRIGLAVLDVFRSEPLPADSPLWDTPRLIISPHTAAVSRHEDVLLAELFLDNLQRFRAWEPLRNEVRTDVWV